MSDNVLGIAVLAALLASLTLAVLLLLIRWPEIEAAFQGVAP